MFHLYSLIACDAFITIPIRSNSVIILKKVVWVIYQLRYFRKFLHSQFSTFIGNSHLVCFYKTIFRKHLQYIFNKSLIRVSKFSHQTGLVSLFTKNRSKLNYILSIIFIHCYPTDNICGLEGNSLEYPNVLYMLFS